MCCRHQSHSVYLLNAGFIRCEEGRQFADFQRIGERRIGIAFAISVSTDSGSSGSTGGQCFPPLACERIQGRWRNANTRLRVLHRQRFSQANNRAFVKAYAVSPGSATISPVTETSSQCGHLCGQSSPAAPPSDVPYAFYIDINMEIAIFIAQSRKLPRRQTPALFTRISMRLLFP